MATIYDVAKSAGVSPKTVSRVLNQDAPVSEAKRHAVEAAIEELDILSTMDDVMIELTIQQNRFPLFGIERDDPQLIQAVEELHNTVPHLEIVEIPDDIEYYIYENEMGVERVHEKHRFWPEE